MDAPNTIQGRRLSNLELVTQVDSWPYFHKDPNGYRNLMSHFYYFMIQGYDKPFGYAHESFVHAVQWPESWTLNHEERSLRLHVFPDDLAFATRTQNVYDTLRSEHERGDIASLRWWNEEMFAINSASNEHVMDMPGSGLDPFGVKSFGCHMIVYTNTKDNGRRYWVPRRSRTKMSYPGKLDNTVGGSLRSGEKPVDCIIREAHEEASLPEEFTSANIKACGSLSYMMSQTDDGQPGCQHQVQYIYEMEVPENMVLKPFDGEAEEFMLMTVEEVQDALAHGEFKLNCAMTWMAFLIRHGVVTAENEPDLLEIEQRLHRSLDMFVVEKMA